MSSTRLRTAGVAAGVFVLIVLGCLSECLALATSLSSEAPLNHGYAEAGLLLPTLGLLLVPPAAAVGDVLALLVSMRRRDRSGRPSPARLVWLTDGVVVVVMALLVVLWHAASGWEWNLFDGLW